MQESTMPSSLQASAISGLEIPCQKYTYLVLTLKANGVEIVYTGNVSEILDGFIFILISFVISFSEKLAFYFSYS